MRSAWIVIALVLGSCGDDTATPILPPATDTAPTSGAGTTTAAVTTSAATTVPATTTAPEPLEPRVAAGADVAQRLATALADADWATARALSPDPPFSDELYEQTLSGLEASTVLLVNGRADGDVVDLWVGQVDHERLPSGRQTTLHCVHWRYDPDSSTLLKVADQTISTEPGYVEPATYASNGAQQCAAFDPPSTPPPDSSNPATSSVELGGTWVEVRHGGRGYLCRRARIGGGDDYDCVRDLGVEPVIVGEPDLRCTRSTGGYECTRDGYYPSELEGYDIDRVEGEQVLCRGDECWIWSPPESPSDATRGSPDFVCDSGDCVRQ